MRELDGAVAQLGERRNGIAKVRGSIPLGSTIPTREVAAAQLIQVICRTRRFWMRRGGAGRSAALRMQLS